MRPIVTVHDGIHVIRDDLFPGGTKARFFPTLYQHHDEVVYASPAEGGAQTALAHVANQLGKRATIFVAGRAARHPRGQEVLRLGGKLVEVRPGYLSVVSARAAAYAVETGAYLLPFGADVAAAINMIAAAAITTGLTPDEVWCAAGSGTLSRALEQAWPSARLRVVAVGRAVSPTEVGFAEIKQYDRPFGAVARTTPPFPSDPHYDAKAWEVCVKNRGDGVVVFWNVTSPAQPFALAPGT